MFLSGDATDQGKLELLPNTWEVWESRSLFPLLPVVSPVTTPFLEYYRGKESELLKVLMSIESECLEVGLRNLHA